MAPLDGRVEGNGFKRNAIVADSIPAIFEKAPDVGVALLFRTLQHISAVIITEQGQGLRLIQVGQAGKPENLARPFVGARFVD